jgi:four helix bundle protein
MKTRHFRDLQVWQKAMDLARETYTATQAFPKEELFGLTSQMRRAAVAIPSNIAEGHGRISDRSFRVFLTQARGSAFELETQTELAAALGYITKSAAKTMVKNCEEVARMLNGLILVLEESE